MPEENALVRVIGPNESRLNITWGGQNGDLPDPIPRDLDDVQIRTIATEAVRGGTVPGIPADPRADFTDFVIERNDPHEARPHHLTQLRPKVPFGLKTSAPSREAREIGPGDFIKVEGAWKEVRENSAFGSEPHAKRWSITTTDGKVYGHDACTLPLIDRYAKREDLE